MPCICYVEKNFATKSLALIEIAVEIMSDYAQRGYDLTLRQLYYQFVARAHIPNKQSEYKRLGEIINDARLAGLLDWKHLVDRTREMKANTHWENPTEIVDACARSYEEDKWSDQDFYVELWIEKEALIGVLERVGKSLDVPRFSCRGYTSQSEMWRAGQRLLQQMRLGKTPYILHFGDHDPSGIDMTRDIRDRLSLFCGKPVQVDRLALNMDQIEQFNPPPNPAKVTDSRYESYRSIYGPDSWELDALDPDVLADIARKGVEDLMDRNAWNHRHREQEEAREVLEAVRDQWDEVRTFLNREDEEGEEV